MIYDKVAGFIEKTQPQFKSIFNKAKLFVFDGGYSDLPDEMPEVPEQFFLPFRSVAVSDKFACTIISDTEIEQTGLSSEREFFTVAPITNNFIEDRFATGYKPEYEKLKEEHELDGSAFFCMTGSIRNAEIVGNELHFDYIIEAGTMWHNKYGDLLKDKEDDSFFKLWDKAALRNVTAAMRELFCFNVPDRFILESKPVNFNPRKRSVKIPRSHQRPQYIILRPTEIRRRLGLGELGTGAKKTPHERRRHFRTLRSDKYKKMKGKTIVVAATWIGPSDAVIGKRAYKILLDR